MKSTSDSNISSSYEEDNEIFDFIDEENITKIENALSYDNKIWEYKSRDNDNSTILHIAVYKKFYKAAELFINYCNEHNNAGLKDFVNAKNDRGITPIHYASFVGDIKIIELLLKYGADYKILTERKLNVIHYAAQGNKPSSLMFFYLNYKNENVFEMIKQQDSGGSTPLHWAAFSVAEDVLQYLINLNMFEKRRERLTYINTEDQQGNTPLHLSVLSKSKRICMKLLQYGANIDKKNHKEITPLEMAISKEQYEIAELIRNNKKCEICNYKAPVKQIEKSYKNLYIVIIFQILVNIIFFISIIPIALGTTDSEIDIIYVVNIILFLIYIILLLLFFIIYIILLIKDPGVVKKGTEDDLKRLLEKNEDLTKYCSKCFIPKSKTIRHCFICDRCFENFDHHCFWINKCVAKHTYRLFLIFLWISCLFLFFSLIISIYSLLKLTLDNYDNDEISYEFKLDNLKLNSKNLITEHLFNKYVHMALNIIIIIILLMFMIPGIMLLGLHMKIYCTDYRKNKAKEEKEEKASFTLIETPLINADGNSETIA